MEYKTYFVVKVVIFCVGLFCRSHSGSCLIYWKRCDVNFDLGKHMFFSGGVTVWTSGFVPQCLLVILLCQLKQWLLFKKKFRSACIYLKKAFWEWDSHYVSIHHNTDAVNCLLWTSKHNGCPVFPRVYFLVYCMYFSITLYCLSTKYPVWPIVRFCTIPELVLYGSSGLKQVWWWWQWL